MWIARAYHGEGSGLTSGALSTPDGAPMHVPRAVATMDVSEHTRSKAKGIPHASKDWT